MGTVNHGCEVGCDELGPYLLGQLGPVEAADVAQRVARCPLCSAQVDLLRPVVAVLDAGSAPDDGGTALPAHPDPDDGLRRLLATVHREGRGAWTRRLALVAAAVVAVAGIAGGVGWWAGSAHHGGADQSLAVTLQGSRGSAGDVQLLAEPWGTAVTLRVSGLAPGATYGVWLQPAVGDRTSAGTFRADGQGGADLELAAALPLGSSDSVGVSRLPARPEGEVVDVLVADLGG